eukprot:Nitzschia sp. Nitz4//scaffold11_size288233//43972//45987//NITZ4_000740-RA/size288233-processed-gene-0.142-mRNA-1//1//CDS//3329533972//8465//frame0
MSQPKKGKPASNKKRASVKKEKDATKNEEEEHAKQSTMLLTRVLMLSISLLVVAAAVLLKPLLDRHATPIKPLNSQSPQPDFSDWAHADGHVGFLVSRACQQMHCHEGLRLTSRYFRATEQIPVGEVLFEIPRSMQLWDLDALRDPWIRLHLFEARHKETGNPVGNEAYLAVYLALRLKRSTVSDDVNPLEVAYYDSLIPYEQFQKTHPIVADWAKMEDILKGTEALDILRAHRTMIMSEFEAFHSSSKQFAEMFTKEEYLMARLNVLTRSIRVGTPGPEHAIKGGFLANGFTDEQLLEDELTAYKHVLGIDLMEQGSIALIPIADLMNHHPNNNAEYGYQHPVVDEEGSFVVRAGHRAIEFGYEPMVSYGALPDAYLFARYGFVNGDGSASSIASIAAYHDILKMDMSSQFDYVPKSGMNSKISSKIERKLVEYLRYDDGYAECIPGPTTHPDEADLKLLKFRHLMKIATKPERWHMVMPPRTPHAFPGRTHETQVSTAVPQYIPDYTKEIFEPGLAQSTCRIMSLTTKDLYGKAAQVLRDNLQNDTFILQEANDALEFRSLLCLARWAGTGLVILEKKKAVESEYEHLRAMNANGAFGTLEWAAYQVRFTEMQALQAVAGMLYERATMGREEMVENPPSSDYHVMNDICPKEYLKFLYDPVFVDKYRVE